ncbi:MAG: ferredoxin--NADP reductase [Cyclobacteriaceae bacterium]|nr:ferredoxin--NADP reductase [Cyclobacteriaceae bacterium]
MFKFLKKKIKGGGSSSDRYLKLKIKEVRKETEDTNTLIFEQPEQGFTYLPGQFLTLILPIQNEKIRRSYSLCTSPHTDACPSITVKRVNTGLVSNYLNDHMKPGDEFEVMTAAGHFVPELNPENKKKYVFFAAGSGITPIMSIIKSVLAVEQQSSIHLVYQNRSESAVIFKEELRRLKEAYPGRFDQIDVLSQAQGDWQGYSGRLDGAMTSDILMDIAGNKVNGSEYYLCGPAAFMQTVYDVLMDFDVPARQVHKESFFADNAAARKETPLEAGTGDEAHLVHIILDGEEFEVNVPANKSILEAALDQHIDMPFSCQSGLCTACRGKLLEGDVEMSDDDGLSQEELRQGYILNCVSKPTGPGVKIEIG